MEILRLKLKNDLLELCETYKTTHSITEDTYDDFVKEQIDLLVKDVNFRIDTTIDERKCMARLWNKGLGEKQCTHCKKSGDYCDKHNRMLAYDGVLRFGDIRKERPTHDLIKQKQGILDKLNWFQSDPIDQLQIILDLQSRKTILATPDLLV
jgi:hypothetical protein